MKINLKMATAVLAVSGIMSTGCSGFLDEKLTTSYSTQYFETEEGLEALAVSLYGHIRWQFAYGWAYPMTLYGVDEFVVGTDGVNELWNTYDVRLGATSSGPSNYTDNADLWDELYYGISSANTIIATADDVFTNEETKNRCLAMAYFLRGYNFYRLTAQYGWCVLQTEPAVGVVRTFEKKSPEECWAQTISDLRMAYELMEGENYYYGKGMTWTKATAGHFLAKALLFRASERNDSWNSAYKASDLAEALSCCNYVIGARALVDDYNDLYNNWTGPDCDIEKTDEILMAATFNSDPSAAGRYGNMTPAIFSPQFSNFANSTTNRGEATGGRDFQRLRPTEYVYGIFDHVNDSRLWKNLKTVYGVNYLNSPPAKSDGTEVVLGEPATVFILNTKDDHTYDGFTFGAARYQEDANFVDTEGRLPYWEKDGRQTQWGESTLSGKPGQAVLNSWICYQNGVYVGGQFGLISDLTYIEKSSNMYAGVTKALSGMLAANGGGVSYTGEYSPRDVTMARLGDTYLMRAEIYVRQGDYASAMKDINVIRQRGAWKEGENRSYQTDGAKAIVNSSYYDSYKEQFEDWNLDMNTYYLSNPGLEVTTASTVNEMTLTSFPDNLPPEDEAVLAELGVTSQYDRALHFILNERTRELLGEYQRWETLSRTGTLIKRAKLFNPDALFITEGKSELRPIPQSFIDALMHEDGTNLSADEKALWQNPGY